MPRHQSLAFASPSLQASTLSSPTHPPGCQRLADSCQSRHGHPPASGPNYSSSSTDWSSHCHPLGPQMNPFQGHDSIYSLVRNKDSFTVAAAATAKTVSTPHGSQRGRVQNTGSLQVDHWLMMGFQDPLVRTLNRKLKADPVPVGSKHWWELAYPRSA